MQHLPKISLIATTYNRPDALRLCIESIGRQTLVPFEVIIADDGSTDDTRTLIERMRKDFPCPIVHAWQEDLGFRAAEVRNNALRLCKGDYVVFIDGDIIIHTSWKTMQRWLSRDITSSAAAPNSTKKPRHGCSPEVRYKRIGTRRASVAE